jgi:DNA-binding protein H-NS
MTASDVELPAPELPAPELPALDSLDDVSLQAVMRRAGELLRQREHARQRDAIERARAILADAGLSVDDLLRVTGRSTATKGARKSTEGAAAGANAHEAPLKGARYANPANPAQIHERGRGREPNWFKELRERGEMPEPLTRPE